MPIDPNHDRSSYSPAYPRTVLDIAKYLKRESVTSPDERIDQARVLDVILSEIQAVQEFLGTSASYTQGQLYSTLNSSEIIYGDGSDGDYTINGGTTTLTRDMYYNDLTITNTGVLKTDGFRVFVKGTLTIQASGTINDDGPAAAAGVGGIVSLTVGSLGKGASGGNSEANGNNITNSEGGAGGDGGGGSGGTGGTATVPSPQVGVFDLAIITTMFLTTGKINGGAGGAGGGNNAGTGGGGGAGGGVVMIAAHTIVNDGSISADGGAGANGSGGGDGGGGGGGGVVAVICNSYTGNDPTADGGALGTGAANGVAGTAGNVFKWVI